MATDFKSFFAQKDIQILFATAPTGLGHIRVTEALKEELGPNIQTETIGIMNPTSQLLHRIMSRYLILRYIMELFQSNVILEFISSWVYRRRLRAGNRQVRKYLVNLIAMRQPTPKLVFVVATHFGLGHQIASIKGRVEKEANVQMKLAVVVTDDSPQKMWAVDGADFIFVPSAFCASGIKKKLGGRIGHTKVIVSPYPVSKKFAEKLTDTQYQKRLKQTDPGPGEKLQIIVPISGAAVQLSYFQSVMEALSQKKDVAFTVVSRESSYTNMFLHWCRRQENVQVIASKSDHEVVELYEKEIEENVFAAEITKPSEQAFKALLTPKMKGGVILLFSGPVGRQEYDNLRFLERHKLVPNKKEMRVLNKLWFFNQKTSVTEEFLRKAKTWRGIVLPRIGVQPSDAILKLYEAGILHAMAKFDRFSESDELKSDGAREFWDRLQKELGKE